MLIELYFIDYTLFCEQKCVGTQWGHGYTFIWDKNWVYHE